MRKCIGVYPTTLHVFCGLGKGNWPCPSEYPMGDMVTGNKVPVTPYWDWFALLVVMWELHSIGLPFVTNSVYNFYGYNFLAQSSRRTFLLRWPQVHVPRTCGHVVLLASPASDLQHALGQFSRCVFESKVVILNQKNVEPHSGLGMSYGSKWRSLRMSGSCSLVKGERSKRWIDESLMWTLGLLW